MCRRLEAQGLLVGGGLIFAAELAVHNVNGAAGISRLTNDRCQKAFELNAD